MTIIKKAILSEKAYQDMEAGIYTFLVDEKSTKKDIKIAIEKQFGITVVKINAARKPQKLRRIGKTRKFAKTAGGKKAVVWLAKGQSIEMLAPKTKSKEKSAKKEKEIQKVAPEGKEG